MLKKINFVIKQTVDENHLYVRTITVENGIEFQRIGLLVYWLKCKVYFCEPYASYQRKSNKNLNGIVCKMYKEGTNFNEITNEQPSSLQAQINNMIGKCLVWSQTCKSLIIKK